MNLRTGEQLLPRYRAVNPQGFVPLLVDGDTQVSQSLAIIEYLEESYPQKSLLPQDAAQRARIRMMAQVIACDIHPINNLRVLKYLADPIGQSQPEVEVWARHWIQKGFETLEALADARGPYIAGEEVTLADVCLVPQLYNARRVNTDLAPYPRLLAIEERLQSLPEFTGARPEALEAISAAGLPKKLRGGGLAARFGGTGSLARLTATIEDRRAPCRDGKAKLVEREGKRHSHRFLELLALALVVITIPEAERWTYWGPRNLQGLCHDCHAAKTANDRRALTEARRAAA